MNRRYATWMALGATLGAVGVVWGWLHNVDGWIKRGLKRTGQ